MNKYINEFIEFLHNNSDELDINEYLDNIIIEISSMNQREATLIKKEVLKFLKQSIDEHDDKILEILFKMILKTKDKIKYNNDDFEIFTDKDDKNIINFLEDFNKSNKWTGKIHKKIKY